MFKKSKQKIKNKLKTVSLDYYVMIAYNYSTALLEVQRNTDAQTTDWRWDGAVRSQLIWSPDTHPPPTNKYIQVQD